ncbi:MAG: TIM-barrel domain-containing protein [Acidobacteriaceae bacterium]
MLRNHGVAAAQIVLKRFGLVVAATLVAACCGPLSAQTSPRPIEAVTGQGAIEITSGSSILDVQIVEDNVVRVHIRPDGQSSPRTLVLDPAYRSPSWVRTVSEDGSYVLSAADLSVHVKRVSPFSITVEDRAGHRLLESVDPFHEAQSRGVAMLHDKGDTFYGIRGFGLRDTSIGLTRNSGDPVVQGIQGDSGGPYIFTVNYGLLIDSDGGEFTTAPGRLTFLHGSRSDVEYFVSVGPPLKTMANLSRLVGPPPLPPKWTLGFLNSQWGSTQKEVEGIVATYRRKQIPIDGFILDFDWKAWGEDNYGEWRWNSTSGPGNVDPDKFPDGASGLFAKTLAAEGVHLAGILKPRILLTVAGNPNQPTMAAAYATEHHLWYPGEPAMPDYFSHRMARDLDFNNPLTRTWFWDHLRPAFHAGMTAWWDDEADVSYHTIFNNFQFLNMGRMLYEGQRVESNLRVWSINRAFYLGASRYGYAGWSGDIRTGFASMAFQRRRMLAALDTGEFHWSMDTGGFSGHPSPENYARWIEFTAFVPIMRVHGALDEKRQPWVYGPTAEAAARDAIDLRYRLLPYIYSYERLGTEGDVGLVRPLFWEFPHDPRSAAQEGEWMFGDSLLVSPVVTQGATSQHVYLPPGEWIDYATGQHDRGARTLQVPVDSVTWKDIPIFVRSGSILATQPLEQYTGERPVSELTLDVFPSTRPATFVVYDDDGKTYDYEKGQYLRQAVTAVRSGGAIKVTLAPPTGSYASSLRTYLLRIHTPAHRVLLNGKPLTSVSAADLSTDPGVNWASSQDRFGPAVLLRVAAGHGPAVVTLR